MSDPNNPLTPRLNEIEQFRDIKNKIINGAFDFWQRGTSFSLSGTSSYTADRFLALNSGVNKVENVNDTRSGVSVTASGAGPSNPCIFLQRIEPIMLADMLGKKGIVSFTIQGTIPGTVVHRGFANYTSPFSFSHTVIPVTTSKVRHYIEFDMTNVNTLTNLSYAESCFDIYTDAAFANQAGIEYPVGISEQTYLGVLTIGDWMLYDSVHGENIPFQRAGRNIVEEYDLCLRYFWQWNVGQVNDYIGTYRDFGSPGGSATFPIPRPFRAFPTISFNATLRAGNANASSSFITGMTTRGLTESQIMCACDLSAEISGIAGDVETLAGGFIRFNAEL